jgi:hypothetical protein
VNFVLNSGRVAKSTMFLMLIAFLIWFIYGTELDRAFSGIPQPESIATPAQGESEIPKENATVSDDYRQEAIVSDVTPSSAPAILSVDEQMRKIDREATLARIEKLASDTLQLDSDLKAWNKTTIDLATNDSGRRLASDPDSFLSVVALLKSEPVSPDDFALLKKRVRVLEDESLRIHSGQSSGTLDGAVTTTKAMFEKMRQSLDNAALSLAALEKRGQFTKPSPMTLADAIVADEETRAADLSSQLSEAKQEADKKIADQKLEAAAMLSKLALEREREKAAAEKAKAQAEIEDARIKAINAAKKQKLEAEFAKDLPQIQHHLGKLFVDGYTQPVSASTYQDLGTHGPVSLGRLKAAGALKDKVEGDGAYSAILHLMVSPSNDRKLSAPYPSDYIGGSPYPAQAAAARPAYLFLRKYGILLVDKGYLAE